ncbi:Conserved domain protein [hydrothermal vent metagenome]|uniref:Conserved domain protein n=1 Tax=hydrothermal vent metagenome TaxID=652676 RepID=A0A1W1CS37_9ZZZZ
MPMIRCNANTHYFDNAKHSQCPFCMSQIGSNKNASNASTVQKTTLESHKNIPNNNNNKTIAPWQRKEILSNENIKPSIAPIVAWLVIIEGENRGQDFRVIPAINTIGRDKSNTIFIDIADYEISREKHCIIEFDVKNNQFYLERGMSTTYLNNKRVGGDGSLLNVGDIIEIGSTKMKFIPFCTEDFSWDL